MSYPLHQFVPEARFYVECRQNAGGAGFAWGAENAPLFGLPFQLSFFAGSKQNAKFDVD